MKKQRDRGDCAGIVPIRDCFGTFPLSTNGVPEARRIAVWREALGRIMRLDVEALPDVSFHADLTMRILPGLGIGQQDHDELGSLRSKLVKSTALELLLQPVETHLIDSADGLHHVGLRRAFGIEVGRPCDRAGFPVT